MYILGNIILATATVLGSALFFIKIVIIASVIVTWVNADPRNQIVHFINRITFPLYRVMRRYIPTFFAGLDFAPLFALFALIFIDIAVVDSLKMLASQLIQPF